MKRFALFVLLAVIFSFTNEKKAYQLYDKVGSKTSYENLLEQAAVADVVLFGELHDNPIAHWLQVELTQDVYAKKNGKIILGAEMYEADDQLIIDEYLQGKHTYKTLTKEAKLWSNDETDYRPLLDFAKDNDLQFVATNVPRRYANLVYRYGFETLDSLEKEALSYIAPIPFPYPDSLLAYSSMMEIAAGHGGENFPKSQAIKDATMAHFISQNLDPNKVFLHFNGSYHSDNFESIAWYLKHEIPNLNLLTISSVEQSSLQELEEVNKAIADFVIVIPSNMTKTY